MVLLPFLFKPLPPDGGLARDMGPATPGRIVEGARDFLNEAAEDTRAADVDDFGGRVALLEAETMGGAATLDESLSLGLFRLSSDCHGLILAKLLLIASSFGRYHGTFATGLSESWPDSPDRAPSSMSL